MKKYESQNKQIDIHIIRLKISDTTTLTANGGWGSPATNVNESLTPAQDFIATSADAMPHRAMLLETSTTDENVYDDDDDQNIGRSDSEDKCSIL